MQPTIKGWRFYTADFSVQAAHSDGELGMVTLRRDPQQTDLWFALSEEKLEEVPLYVSGEGLTFDAALRNAESIASQYPAIMVTITEGKDEDSQGISGTVGPAE